MKRLIIYWPLIAIAGIAGALSLGSGPGESALVDLGLAPKEEPPAPEPIPAWYTGSPINTPTELRPHFKLQRSPLSVSGIVPRQSCPLGYTYQERWRMMTQYPRRKTVVVDSIADCVLIAIHNGHYTWRRSHKLHIEGLGQLKLAPNTQFRDKVTETITVDRFGNFISVKEKQPGRAFSYNTSPPRLLHIGDTWTGLRVQGKTTGPIFCRELDIGSYHGRGYTLASSLCKAGGLQKSQSWMDIALGIPAKGEICGEGTDLHNRRYKFNFSMDRLGPDGKPVLPDQ